MRKTTLLAYWKPLFLCAAASALLLLSLLSFRKAPAAAWIRINQLGYTPASKKVAVWGSKEEARIASFRLVDSATGRTVYSARAGRAFGAYGPFVQTYRLDFSAYRKPGTYY